MDGAGQLRESRVSSKVGVHMEIVRAVVFVYGRSGENRVEVQGRDPQLLQIGQLIPDSLQVSSVKIQGASHAALHRRRLPAAHPDGGTAVQGVLPGLHVVGRVAVAEALREDLIKDSLLHPGGLHVVGQQHKVSGLVLHVGCDAPLGIIVDHAAADQIKLVLHPVFRDLKRRFVVNQAPLGFDWAGLGDALRAVMKGAEHYVAHRRAAVHPNPDGRRFVELRRRRADELRRTVAVDAFQPFFHCDGSSAAIMREL